MHSDDLAALGELVIGARNLVNGIRLLLQIPPQTDVTTVKQILTQTTRDLATLTEYLQQREAVSWGTHGDRAPHKPRHPPNRWITAKSDLRATRERQGG